MDGNRSRESQSVSALTADEEAFLSMLKKVLQERATVYIDATAESYMDSSFITMQFRVYIDGDEVMNHTGDVVLPTETEDDAHGR